jgi:hypothetical protein
MKKLAWSCAFVTLTGMLSSCNEKLKIAAPYKNITVVYGLLDMGDTAHYIRIQKAFMDENKTALSMAKEADSSFYRSLEVSVKELSAGGAVLYTNFLDRVNLIAEGFPKDTGVFFNTPSYAYKFRYTLNPANKYRIVIRNKETGVVDSAETPVINSTLPLTSFGIRQWINPAMKINFARYSNPTGSGKSSYEVVVPPAAYMAQVVLRFNWMDTNTATNTSTWRSADFLVGQQTVTPSQTTSFIVVNNNIYDFLEDAMGTPGGDELRYMDSCDMFLYVAGEEYEKFNRLNQNQGGLTANEIRPVYTNIKGTDVMGLLSTRASKYRLRIAIDDATRDSLAENLHTKELKIRFK